MKVITFPFLPFLSFYFLHMTRGESLPRIIWFSRIVQVLHAEKVGRKEVVVAGRTTTTTNVMPEKGGT